MCHNKSMDSIFHFENERFVGRTNFKGGLMTNLVILSVKDVEGVLRMSRRDYKNGVRVKFKPEGVTIDVSIWTKFGHSAADVSYRVQENILNVVSGLIEDKIKNVNVRINGVGEEDGVQSKKVS